MLKLLEDFQFNAITEESLLVDDVLALPLAYEQGLVKYIHSAVSWPANTPWDAVKHSKKAFKIEGYEKLNLNLFDECRYLAEHFKHHGPVTCHLFRSPKASESFPTHTDPDDVVLYMVSGSKVIEGSQGEVLLEAGDILYIPAGTPHRAINTADSIMLSFGLERFLVEKLYVG